MIAISGSHGSGKKTLLKYIAGTAQPEKGSALVPMHLSCLEVPQAPYVFAAGDFYENLTFGSSHHIQPDRLRGMCEMVGMGKHMLAMLDKALSGESGCKSLTLTGDRDDCAVFDVHGHTPEGGATSWKWLHELSYSDLRKLHLARALIHHPEVLLLHRPVDELDRPDAERVLHVLRKFVDERGLEINAEEARHQLPRTVFFTTGPDPQHIETAVKEATRVWQLSGDGLKVVDPLRLATKSGIEQTTASFFKAFDFTGGPLGSPFASTTASREDSRASERFERARSPTGANRPRSCIGYSGKDRTC
eukprot:TRINITY_DN18842_c0_g1_i1.p1 TRINITY_DN18842_c0_g1~~TRINITY_DN18842_c0_g1_i1.p1  ORF type:complete len:305 (+),score=40.41 TRINITY_DN18842_c0_g1_i1:306-1220(+)